MTWIAIIALAGVTFAAATAVLGVPRTAWSVLGAALMFGLAGYAVQGSPDSPAAPARSRVQPPQTGELLVSARREFYGRDSLPSRYVLTADAFARRGQFEDAAGFLGNALEEDQRDSEAWLALAIVLVEHAGGRLTPAAQTAFDRAALSDPRQLGPAFFYGLTQLRANDPQAAREVWGTALASAPADAEGRAMLGERLALLEALLQRSAAAQGGKTTQP